MIQDALKKPWPTVPTTPSPAEIGSELEQQAASAIPA